jgi:POT family proton-dependent oligopeptide transporter
MMNDQDSQGATGLQEPVAGVGDTPDIQTREGVKQGGFLSYLGRHPKGFWFFFWGEFAERCSYYGMRAILAMYMADQLGLGQANSAVYMSFFIGACYFLPLVGGWVADNYFGKYWTIVGFSLPYILGHLILGIENVPCLIIALCLLAMGSGVIKPNISTLMGLTYDQQRPGETKLRSDAFAIFYFSINVGAAISQFAMPPIRSQYGYAIAFMFPAALMVVAFLIFAAGKRYYAIEVIEHQARSPEENAERWRVLGRIFGLFFLVMFFWAIFDQAASTWVFFTEACMNRHIFGYEMDADQMQAFNPVLILILLPPITIFVKYLQEKGWRIRPTDKMLVGFGLTAGCMAVMAVAAVLAGQADLRPGLATGKEDKAFALSVTGPGSFSFQTDKADKLRINATSQKSVSVSYPERGSDQKPTGASVTLLFSGDGVLKLADVEEREGFSKLRIDGNVTKLEKTVAKGDDKQKETVMEGSLSASFEGDLGVSRRWFVAPEHQVTVWWLVLAYLVITIGEVLISVTGLELAYTAAPKSMTGFVTACWLLTVALANWLINVPITMLYPVMQPALYFLMLTIIMLIVTARFVTVGKRFNTAQAAEAE